LVIGNPCGGNSYGLGDWQPLRGE